jgi:YD repeat-containing protein
MSKDYNFTADMTVPVGNPTKKSDYDKVSENTDEINQRLEGLPFLGFFLPQAGSAAVAYDGSGRVSTITWSTSPVGVATVVYDDVNGGRIDYIEAVLTDPVAATIREMFSYDGSNNVTGSTRMVS